MGALDQLAWLILDQALSDPLNAKAYKARRTPDQPSQPQPNLIFPPPLLSSDPDIPDNAIGRRYASIRITHPTIHHPQLRGRDTPTRPTESNQHHRPKKLP